MNTSINIRTGLDAWKTVYMDRMDSPKSPGDHISIGGLYKMALDGAMVECDSEKKAHLSQCPICLEKWAGLRKAMADLSEADEYEEESIMSWGMLQAAADDGPMEPVSLKSPCGQFTLGIFPQMDDSDNGMVSLELASETAGKAEGKTAVVRDAKSRILIRGTIRQGRLARKIEDLDSLDLSHWTVVVQ